MNSSAKQLSSGILFSIILPVYNTGAILQETIDSVLNQTCRTIELIIVDDGSSDPVTARILSNQSDDRIKIIRQANAGVAAARNQGIVHAQGRYIAFLDHDDLYLPEKLEKTLNLFQLRQDAVLVYSDTIPFGSFQNRRIELEKAEGRVFSVVIRQNPILSMSCSVVDRTFLDEHNIKFNTDCVPCDDWDFHLQCALHGSIYCTAEPLVKYRYHDNNLSSNAIKMYYAGINVINKYQNMIADISLQSGISRRELQESLNFIAFKHYYGLAFEYLKTHEYTLALRNMLKALGCSPLKCMGRILRFLCKKVVK